VRRQQIRKGGRWIHKKSQRVALVTGIVYPHSVEYKYERPSHWKQPGDWTREPYTRGTRSSYLRFLLNFERGRAA
jgi:hypothetical protein